MLFILNVNVLPIDLMGFWSSSDCNIWSFL